MPALRILWIVLLVPVAVAAAVVLVYNRLVVLRQRVRNAFSQIDVQLHRRHSLIPNLVETARGYLAHEAGTLEAVAAARTLAATAWAATKPRLSQMRWNFGAASAPSFNTARPPPVSPA